MNILILGGGGREQAQGRANEEAGHSGGGCSDRGVPTQ